jgi:hypothetical protein
MQLLLNKDEALAIKSMLAGRIDQLNMLLKQVRRPWFYLWSCLLWVRLSLKWSCFSLTILT